MPKLTFGKSMDKEMKRQRKAINKETKKRKMETRKSLKALFKGHLK